jgi:release factor glutamine methyltransferase
VLIPRPETELLVEAALAWAGEHNPGRIVDAGTGSGCIAVTLARHLPQATIIAGDVSAAALALARRNAERHDVAARIDFFQGSLLQPLAAGLALIVANLPYVSDAEWTTLDDAVKWYEPAGALRGGQGGLDLIGELLHEARPRLAAGGAIFLEIGWRQGAAARQLAQSVFPTAAITIQTDYAGHDRIVRIETA